MEKYMRMIKNPRDANNRFFNTGVSWSSNASSAASLCIDVKEVTSSHKKAETQIISEEKLDEDKLKAEVDEIGYKVIEIEVEPYEKKKISLFHK